MPLALRGASIRLQQALKRSDGSFLRDIHERFKGMENALIGLVQEMAKEVASSGTYSPDKMRKAERKWLRRMETQINSVYFSSASGANKHPIQAYTGTHDYWLKQIKRLFPVRFFETPKQRDRFERFERGQERVQEQEKSYVPFVAGPDDGFGTAKAFGTYAANRFGAGESPQVKIKTLSSAHRQELYKRFLAAVEEGQGALWTRDDFIRRMSDALTDPKVRRQMEYNVLRIVRTEYGAASNHVTSQFAQSNRHIVKELERVADGRPCLACIALDGKRYPVGAEMDDHPNGMCTFAPVLFTLEELGYEKDDLPEKYTQAWRGEEQQYPLLSSRFYNLPDEEKLRIFGSKELFELWKKERFPLEKMVLTRQGMTVPATAKDILSDIKAFGGVSAPSAATDTVSAEYFQKVFGEPENFWKQVDGMDRADADVTIFSEDAVKKALGDYAEGPYRGINLLSGEIDLAKVDPSLRARLHQYGWDKDPSKLSIYEYNQRARLTGLYVRKFETGEIYYTIPTKRISRAAGPLRLTPHPVKIKAPDVKPPKVRKPRAKKPKVEPIPEPDIKALQQAAGSESPEEFAGRFIKSKSTEELETKKLSESGVNQTQYLRTKDGREYLHKTSSTAYVESANEAAVEELYYETSRTMGFDVVPRTGALGRTESVQEFLPKSQGWASPNTLWDRDGFHVVDEALKEFFDTHPRGEESLVLDYLFGQRDRHGANIFLKWNAKTKTVEDIRLIDNGLSLYSRLRGSNNRIYQSLFASETEIAIQSQAVKNQVLNWAKRLGYDETVGIGGTTEAKAVMWKKVEKNWLKFAETKNRHMKWFTDMDKRAAAADAAADNNALWFMAGTKRGLRAFVKRLKDMLEGDFSFKTSSLMT